MRVVPGQKDRVRLSAKITCPVLAASCDLFWILRDKESPRTPTPRCRPAGSELLAPNPSICDGSRIRERSSLSGRSWETEHWSLGLGWSVWGRIGEQATRRQLFQMKSSLNRAFDSISRNMSLYRSIAGSWFQWSSFMSRKFAQMIIYLWNVEITWREAALR